MLVHMMAYTLVVVVEVVEEHSMVVGMGRGKEVHVLMLTTAHRLVGKVVQLGQAYLVVLEVPLVP